MKVTVESVKLAKDFLNRVNRVDFNEIEFTENNETLEISDDLKEEWRFIGLGNVDFITSGFYKNGGLKFS